MKRIIFCVLTAMTILCSKDMAAQIKSEDVLINRILTCLQRTDDSVYASFFPTFEDMVIKLSNIQPATEADEKRLSELREYAYRLQRFDPEYNHDILREFRMVIKKGKDSGLHWNDVLLAKFELDKQRLPDDLKGFEQLATLRMGGYFYVKDMLTRRQYMIAVTDVMMIGDQWYGGRVVNILEADNEDEYRRKLDAERRFIQLALENGPEFLDSVRKEAKKRNDEFIQNGDEEEEEKRTRTEVMERKIYHGTFDKEIPVELYIRSLKGPCPETICAWEAMYKFGDMEYYSLLEVAKIGPDTWSFTEEDVGVMELKKTGNKFTGAWISFRDKTEYEVRITEKEDVKSKKLFKLDSLFEAAFSPAD